MLLHLEPSKQSPIGYTISTTNRPYIAAPHPQYELSRHESDQDMLKGAIVTPLQGRPIRAGTLCLPHASWRNTGWLRKNLWFETELLPEIRAHR